jgi:hypothetical protein
LLGAAQIFGGKDLFGDLVPHNKICIKWPGREVPPCRSDGPDILGPINPARLIDAGLPGRPKSSRCRGTLSVQCLCSTARLHACTCMLASNVGTSHACRLRKLIKACRSRSRSSMHAHAEDFDATALSAWISLQSPRGGRGQMANV